MSQLGRMAYKRGKPLLTYKDTVHIPALGMIDDIATVSKCGIDTVIANSVTNTFIESKRLQLGEKKSHRIHIGRKNNECADLKIHGNKMHDSRSETYVGDIITEDGKNDANIASRRAKAYAIAGDILAILEEVPLGIYRIEAGLYMRNGIFLNAILPNSEVWYGLKTEHITDLEKVDEYLIRKILNAHSKTAKEILYLETGAIPIRYVIKNRRLSYLKNILTRDKDELISKVYHAQQRRPVKDGWVESINNDIEEIELNLSEEKINSM